MKPLLEQDMAEQARMVEVATLVVFVLLLLAAWGLWQFQLDIAVTAPGGAVSVEKMNLFRLLFLKK